MKLFLDTPVQDKHEDFIKISELITALLLAVVPISPWRQKFRVHDWPRYIQFAIYRGATVLRFENQLALV